MIFNKKCNSAAYPQKTQSVGLVKRYQQRRAESSKISFSDLLTRNNAMIALILCGMFLTVVSLTQQPEQQVHRRLAEYQFTDAVLQDLGLVKLEKAVTLQSETRFKRYCFVDPKYNIVVLASKSIKGVYTIVDWIKLDQREDSDVIYSGYNDSGWWTTLCGTKPGESLNLDISKKWNTKTLVNNIQKGALLQLEPGRRVRIQGLYHSGFHSEHNDKVGTLVRKRSNGKWIGKFGDERLVTEGFKVKFMCGGKLMTGTVQEKSGKARNGETKWTVLLDDKKTKTLTVRESKLTGLLVIRPQYLVPLPRKNEIVCKPRSKIIRLKPWAIGTFTKENSNVHVALLRKKMKVRERNTSANGEIKDHGLVRTYSESWRNPPHRLFVQKVEGNSVLHLCEVAFVTTVNAATCSKCRGTGEVDGMVYGKNPCKDCGGTEGVTEDYLEFDSVHYKIVNKIMISGRGGCYVKLKKKKKRRFNASRNTENYYVEIRGFDNRHNGTKEKITIQIKSDKYKMTKDEAENLKKQIKTDIQKLVDDKCDFFLDNTVVEKDEELKRKVDQIIQNTFQPLLDFANKDRAGFNKLTSLMKPFLELMDKIKNAPPARGRRNSLGRSSSGSVREISSFRPTSPRDRFSSLETEKSY